MPFSNVANKSILDIILLLFLSDIPFRPDPRINVQGGQIIQIVWDAPFSWPTYPITSYNLSIQSSGDFWSDQLDGNLTSYNFTRNYSITFCTNMTVWLVAQNEVGFSLPGKDFRHLPAGMNSSVSVVTEF